MKNYLLEYKIKPGNLDDAKEIIKNFINYVDEEENTLLYSPFHYKLESHRFLHVISFENEEAERKHMEAEYTKEFLKKLAEISIIEPTFTEIEYLGDDE